MSDSAPACDGLTGRGRRNTTHPQIKLSNRIASFDLVHPPGLEPGTHGRKGLGNHDPQLPAKLFTGAQHRKGVSMGV